MRLLGIGLLVSITGMALDVYWHSQGLSDDAYPVFPAHVVLIIGLFIAAAGGKRAYEGSTGRQRTLLKAITVLAAAAGTARTFDEILHFQDIDESIGNTIGHLIGDIGFLVLIVLGIVAWRLKAREQSNDLSTAD